MITQETAGEIARLHKVIIDLQTIDKEINDKDKYLRLYYLDVTPWYSSNLIEKRIDIPHGLVQSIIHIIINSNTAKIRALNEHAWKEAQNDEAGKDDRA